MQQNGEESCEGAEQQSLNRMNASKAGLPEVWRHGQMSMSVEVA